MSGSKDVSLTIFIASVSGSENLTSFVNRFSGLPSFRMAFDAAKSNRKFDRIQCQRSSRKKRRVFLCRRTVRVEVKDKVTPARFLKTKGRRSLERKTGEKATINGGGR